MNEERPDFQLEVVLRGPERDLLAQLDVPVSEIKGWSVFQEAVRSCLQPDFIITLPEGLSAEEAERIRDEWKKRVHK